jgi:methylthioribose-1-phosphate isomerase
VELVVIGADRICADGSVVNKIGSYSLAVLAEAHGVPFIVVAPTSTIDLATASGDDVEIEHRAGEEVTSYAGRAGSAGGNHRVQPGVRRDATATRHGRGDGDRRGQAGRRSGDRCARRLLLTGRCGWNHIVIRTRQPRHRGDHRVTQGGIPPRQKGN